MCVWRGVEGAFCAVCTFLLHTLTCRCDGLSVGLVGLAEGSPCGDSGLALSEDIQGEANQNRATVKCGLLSTHCGELGSVAFCIWKHTVWLLGLPPSHAQLTPQLWRVSPDNFLMLRGCTASTSNCSATRSPSHFCQDENVSLCIWRFSDWGLVVFPTVVRVPGHHPARS